MLAELLNVPTHPRAFCPSTEFAISHLLLANVVPPSGSSTKFVPLSRFAPTLVGVSMMRTVLVAIGVFKLVFR